MQETPQNDTLARSSLSQINQHQVNSVSLPEARDYTSALWRETVELLWPKKRDYPGFYKSASAVTGHGINTVRRWLYPGTYGISAKARARMIAYLIARREVLDRLIGAWIEMDRVADNGETARQIYKRARENKAIFD